MNACGFNEVTKITTKNYLFIYFYYIIGFSRFCENFN